MIRQKVKCEFCGREISKSNIKRHLTTHQQNSEPSLFHKYQVTHDGLICQFCGKVCKNKNSLTQHELRCRKNPNRKAFTNLHQYSQLGQTAWNAGLTKHTDERVRKQAETISKRYRNGDLKWHMNDETKQKLSNALRNYLQKNPDKVPYLRNHSSKMSYPEKYFMDVFQTKGLSLKYHHRVGIYELDFADVDKMIDIEIDGEQHYFDERAVKRDVRRNKYLTALGWTVYRVRWSHFCAMTREQKDEIISYIQGMLTS